MGIVIYPPTIDWGYMKQRPQHVMSMFASHGIPVLYFNKRNQEGPVIEKAAPNLYVIHHFEFFMQALYGQLQGERLLWSSWSKMLGHASRFRPNRTVYDCVDDFPDWEADEKKWAHVADLIVCTAEHLQEKMRALVPDKPNVLIRNGCDWNHFAAKPSGRSPALSALPPTAGYRIGYVGAWAPWVDEQLVRKTAAAFPDSQLVIVGPKLRSDADDLGPNVFNLGYMDYQELPLLLAGLDVCLIPFRLNRITESTNPIKVYEYLAAGKPVVSTGLPEVRKLAPTVSVADDHESFIEAVRLALTTTPEERERLSQYARSFSWEQRFDQIHMALHAHCPEFFTPVLDASAVSALDRLCGTYASTSKSLRHGTVNSYYRKMALPQDPPMIGTLTGGEYQCCFQLDSSASLPDFEKAYLEFEVNASEQSSREAVIEIGVGYTPWSRSTLTYENKPPMTTFTRFRPADFVSETISIEVTSYFRQNHRPSFQLRTDHNQLIGIGQARMTFITKETHNEWRG
ncbi:glycosyltransferase [Paenibacillus chartarius]|uniref:Glycosyltransferase n=1 Tax=Paenibacillus chartarius TaxID=747481 RepID=A0ABV6DRJ3_9BACL